VAGTLAGASGAEASGMAVLVAACTAVCGDAAKAALAMDAKASERTTMAAWRIGRSDVGDGRR
jgi:uncharacterized membrane protein YadS